MPAQHQYERKGRKNQGSKLEFVKRKCLRCNREFELPKQYRLCRRCQIKNKVN